jgi:hypothetical protein
MNRPNKRGRIAVLLAVAAAAVAALVALPGTAVAKDRNHDHIPDRWERSHHLSLKVNQARRDQDRDHLRNRAEFLAGDNPRNADTDGDGIPDGEEQAGTIESFDTESGRLVIDLFGSDTVSGFVTEETEIKCEGSDNSSRGAHRMARSDGSGSSGGDGEESGDDNGGQGEEEPGDDNGENGEEPGDDNGGEEEAGSCGTAALVPGAVVQQAELHVVGGKAVFEEVELAH